MNNVRIMYLRDNANRPVACLAITFQRSRGEVLYNYTVQNPVDSYDKMLGRQLAIGRMVETPFKVKVNKEANMHEVSYAVLTDMVSPAGAKTTPTRAYKAAQRWLNDVEQGANSFEIFCEEM